jgi:hypothetical protein
MSLWQIIFLRSKVNHARYEGDHLLTSNWNWPKETSFQCGCVIFAELLAKPPKDQPGKDGQRPGAETHRRFRKLR